MEKQIHPAEQKFMDRCKEINLSKQDTAILKDMLCWNNLGGKEVPKTHLLVAPAVVMIEEVVGLSKKEKALSKSIAELVQRLIPKKTLEAIKTAPIETLKTELEINEHEAVWIFAQLVYLGRKTTSAQDVQITNFVCLAPEQKRPIIVRATCALLGHYQK